MDPNLTNLYSAAAAEKVSSAKRAAETRKALSSGASKILGELDEDTVSIVEETPEESPWARQGRKRLFSFKKKRNTDEAEGNITDDAESGVTNYVANDVATEVPADVATDVAKIVATIAARGAANGIASGVAKVVTGDPESGDPISVWG